MDNISANCSIKESLTSQFEKFDNADEISPVRRRAMIMIALGEFLDGYDLIVIAGALIQLESQFNLTASKIGLLGGSAFFGSALGLIGAGYIADRVGRRMIFVYNFILFAILSFISAFIVNFEQLFGIRFLLGVAIGADIAISIPFLAEIAPRKSRGKWAGAIPQIAWTGGAIISLGLALLLMHLIGDSAWRWLFGLGTIPAIIILIGRHGIPESPHWLLSRGRNKEAAAAMQVLGLHPAGEDNVHAASSTSDIISRDRGYRGSFLDIFRKPYTKKAILVIAVLGLGPLAASAASVAAPYVFRHVGLMGPTAALTGSMLIWVGGISGSILAYFTVEKFGRLRSSAISMWGCAACLILLALTFHLPVLFIAIYVLYGVFVWFGSSSTWLLPAEMLPAHLRARAQGVGSGLTRLSAGFTTWLIPTGVASVGFGFTFMSLALIGIGLGIYIWMNLDYETTGKTLEI